MIAIVVMNLEASTGSHAVAGQSGQTLTKSSMCKAESTGKFFVILGENLILAGPTDF